MSRTSTPLTCETLGSAGEPYPLRPHPDVWHQEARDIYASGEVAQHACNWCSNRTILAKLPFPACVLNKHDSKGHCANCHYWLGSDSNYPKPYTTNNPFASYVEKGTRFVCLIGLDCELHFEDMTQFPYSKERRDLRAAIQDGVIERFPKTMRQWKNEAAEFYEERDAEDRRDWDEERATDWTEEEEEAWWQEKKRWYEEAKQARAEEARMLGALKIVAEKKRRDEEARQAWVEKARMFEAQMIAAKKGRRDEEARQAWAEKARMLDAQMIAAEKERRDEKARRVWAEGARMLEVIRPAVERIAAELEEAEKARQKKAILEWRWWE